MISLFGAFEVEVQLMASSERQEKRARDIRVALAIGFMRGAWRNNVGEEG